VLQFSLGTRTLKEAKRKREIADIEWSARFAAAENRSGTTAQGAGTGAAPGLSNASLTRLVWDYVERMDERFRARVAGDPPENEAQKAAITTDVEIGLQILENRDDPRAEERVDGTSERLLRSSGLSSDDLGDRYAGFAELVRRALLELDRRRCAHFADEHGHACFDRLNALNLRRGRPGPTAAAGNGLTSRLPPWR
jgi:hypothetical protein